MTRTTTGPRAPSTPWVGRWKRCNVQTSRYSTDNVDKGEWWPDCVVLEEPEHLNWYSFVEGHPSSWRSSTDHVVGVIHTHYVRYAATERMCPGPLGYLVHPVVGPTRPVRLYSWRGG